VSYLFGRFNINRAPFRSDPGPTASGLWEAGVYYYVPSLGAMHGLSVSDASRHELSFKSAI
jgi:hypothetical protein